MITPDLLTEFVREHLRYKGFIINYWNIYNRVLEIKFANGYGEIVELKRYHRWLSDKRNQKIVNLLD